MKNKLMILFIFFNIIIFPFKSSAWNGETHKLLTEYAVKNSMLGNINLCQRLNLDKGIYQESLTIRKWPFDVDWCTIKKPINKWFQIGAEMEDDANKLAWVIPYNRRYDNHFHNPLDPWNGKQNPWDQAGLDDWVWLPPDGPNIKYWHCTGRDAILWAQYSGAQSGYPQGDQSWNKIREYYYKALISGTDENGKNDERENYFARTFKGLGHQMHLVQDMSVPEHVRNDGHPDKERYEKFTIESWAENDITEGRNTIESLAQQNPKDPEVNLNTSVYNNLVPITQLSDINVYDGTNPSNTNQQGLAEYTNSNFFSEDTIFTSEEDDPNGLLRHRFPYPRKSSTNLQQLINDELLPEEVEAENGKRYRCWWIKKKGHGEIIDHILAVGYLEKYVREKDNKTLYRRTFFKNWLTHNDYAEKLVPRAVGYSSALIDYFFRGEIEITLPTSPEGTPPPQKDGIYAFTDDNVRAFKEISLGIKDVTPVKEGEDPEVMENGTLILVVRYRQNVDGIEYPFNQEIPPRPDETKTKYIVSEPIQFPGIVPRDKTERVTFHFSSNPIPITIPINATDINLTVVFRGDLGHEKLSAVAIGFKDIGEPTPIDLYNNTDKVCFNGTYVDWLDPSLWDEVDKYPLPPNGPDGKIDCLTEENITPNQIKPMYISFNGLPANENNYYYAFDHSQGDIEIFPPMEMFADKKKYIRIYVLADEGADTINFSTLVHAKTITHERIVNPLKCISYYTNEPYPFNSRTNKLVWNSDPTGPHYVHYRSTMGSFRGMYYFNLKYYENISYPEGSDCSISQLSAAATSFQDSEETIESLSKDSVKKVVVNGPKLKATKKRKDYSDE